jgi:hypothetical protein
MRQNKNLEPRSDSIGTEKALERPTFDRVEDRKERLSILVSNLRFFNWDFKIRALAIARRVSPMA